MSDETLSSGTVMRLHIASHPLFVTNEIDKHRLATLGLTASLASSDSLPVAMRRRVPVLSKLVLGAVLQSVHCADYDFAVFSSRHGEVAQRWQCAQSLLANEMLSPTVFSQSVHNTPAGLLSIVAQWQAPTLSIAHQGHLSSALQQAWLYLCQYPQARVLVVVYEPELPEPLQRKLASSWPAMAQVFSVSLPAANTWLQAVSKRAVSAELVAENDNELYLWNAVIAQQPATISSLNARHCWHWQSVA